MTLKAQGHRSKQMAPLKLHLKDIDLDAKIIILSALVQSYGQRCLFA